MGELLPLEHSPAIETARRRTLTVGARLERASLRASPAEVPEAQTGVLVILSRCRLDGE